MSQIRSTPSVAVRAALLIALSLAVASAIFGQTAADSIGRCRIQPLPALGSAPETGLQFGATALAVWEPAAVTRTRPSSLIASALRTTRSQTRLRLEGEHWTRGNAQRVSGSLQWQEFPLPYFGVGDRTSDAAELIYVPRGTEGVLSVQQRLRGSLYALVSLRHLDQRITSDSGSPLLASRVPGARGGRTTELTGGLQYDTRDNLFAPRAGQWLQLTYARSRAGVLSDFTYGTLRLDARAYREVRPAHVLAFQVQSTSVTGGAPFDALALVGNSDIMRGYTRGRYRDRLMTAAQGEYRSPLWRRVGGVVFGGAGITAPDLSSLTGRRVLPTYGAGLRVQIDARQRTGVRADYGRGVGGASGLYIGFNQAF